MNKWMFALGGIGKLLAEVGTKQYATNRFGVAWVWCVVILRSGCRSQSSVESTFSGGQAPTDVNSIVHFCVDCHELPRSASFAKDRWQEEVEQGIRIYEHSGRTDLVIPDLDATVAFFRDTAPDKLVILPPERTADSLFVARRVAWPNEQKTASISSIRLLHPPGERPQFLLTDMSTGAISRVVVESDDVMRVSEIGAVAHPAHIEPVDLDKDGERDYVVADLGTLNPQVENQGSVWVLRGQDGEFKRHALKLGLSRVADVQPIDYDSDGDLDLIAGDFGFHFVGSIYLGTNEGQQGDLPRYSWQVIDPRPGTISLPTVDFDGDGRTDFLALIAQHYETVELKLNRGDGKFETKVIYAAGDPSWGTSGMELIDFDGDGDLDVLYTNGDTFDDTLAKPYHGIKWLENEGSFPFTVHEVAEMPGCYRAVAGDIDGDGDSDIAAVAYLSTQEVSKYAPDTFDGVAWFEQQDGGRFVRHSLQKNVCEAATCALTDWDVDGDLDLVVPPSTVEHRFQDGLTVFLNRRLGAGTGERP
ncbi:MAG: FG-GAP repeat domain-containing protein [Planctomycetaceae bacterium]